MSLLGESKPAGISCFKESDHVIDCLTYNITQDNQKLSSNVIVRKDYYNPPLGRKKFNGTFEAEEVAKLEKLSHGKMKGHSTQASDVLNPKPTTWFNNLLNTINEQNYEKNKFPLGSKSTKFAYTPKNFDQFNYTCGMPNKVEKNKNIVNYDVCEKLDPHGVEKIHKQYILSHKSYYPSEQLTRDYNPPFDRNHYFGILSQEKTFDGTNGKRGTEIPISVKELKQGATVCDKSLTNWRDLNKCKLSETQDPIRSTKNLPEDYTFGISSSTDKIGVSEILHENKFDDINNLSPECQSLIADLRRKLKNNGLKNFTEFEKLLRNSNNQSNTDLIKICDFLNVVDVMKINLDENYINFIIHFCSENEPQFLNIAKIINVMNYNRGFHNIEFSNSEFKVSSQNLNSSQTSYSQYSKASLYNGLCKDKTDRVYGLPTVRRDLTPPVIKKTSDFTSYGDELNAHAVLNPSIFTNWGLKIEDILKPLTMDGLNELLINSKIKLDQEQFESLYKTAAGHSEQTNVSDFLHCYYDQLKY